MVKPEQQENGRPELQQQPNLLSQMYSSAADGLNHLSNEYVQENFFLWILEECYFTGSQLLRSFYDFRRWVQQTSIRLSYGLSLMMYQLGEFWKEHWGRWSESCMEPFQAMQEAGRDYRRARRLCRQLAPDDPTRRSQLSMLWEYLCTIRRPLDEILSYLAPIVGCSMLAAVCLYFVNLQYGLRVEYAGEFMGYVANENDFYAAQEAVADRLMGERLIIENGGQPTFQIVVMGPDGFTAQEDITNHLLSMSDNQVNQADGIYMDGVFLGAVENGDEFLFYIDSILDSYRTGADHELVQCIKKISVRRGVYPLSSMRPLSDIENALESNARITQEHVVQQGDTLEKIAAEHGTTTDHLLQLNPALDRRVISTGVSPKLVEGETIVLEPVELNLGIQVTRRETYTEDISYGTTYQDDNRYPEGYEELISKGKPGERTIVADITYVDGKQVGENRISETVTKEATNAVRRRGTMVVTPDTSASAPASNDTGFIWPVNGGYISCGLWGYAGHTGLDIAAPSGTYIYATRSGTVTYASNYSVGAYGKRIDIDCGGGITTRYAHCSKVMVTQGQYVKQGQLIALVGRTGNATGNHLHLEIRVNGKIMDPQKYVGSKSPY